MKGGLFMPNMFFAANGGEILFTVLMGLGTVFFGLICIIAICKLMSVIVRVLEKKPEPKAAKPLAEAPKSVIENRGELCAAVAAAIAETTGRDVDAIRIVSIKKV